MKTQKSTVAAVLLTLVIGFGLVACNQSSSNNAQEARPAAPNPGNVPTAATGTQAVAAVTSQSDPTPLVQLLFNGIIASSSIGTVNPSGGITFFGLTVLDGKQGAPTRNVIGTQSYISMIVNDSYATAKQAGPMLYQVGLNQTAVQGTVVNSNGTSNATIYYLASINGAAPSPVMAIQGSFPGTGAGTFSGQIYVYSGNQPQLLGNFSMPTCGFFSCQ